MAVQGALQENALKGKTIVVTGGGTGLGKAMSTYFSELGANVVISSRKLDVLEETAKEIQAKTGNPVLPVACDIRHPEEIALLKDKAIEIFGQVDVLVNNAGMQIRHPSSEFISKCIFNDYRYSIKGNSKLYVRVWETLD